MDRSAAELIGVVSTAVIRSPLKIVDLPGRGVGDDLPHHRAASAHQVSAMPTPMNALSPRWMERDAAPDRI